MFEFISWTYASILFSVSRVIKVEKETLKTFTDPGTFLSGAVAGGAGRAVAFAVDPGSGKGFSQTVGRRMPQFGLLMMFYCPVAHQLLPGLEADPPSKLFTTFIIGACAGFNMRLFTNPISRVMDESARTGKAPIDVARLLKSKTILQFWYTTPNLFANALYFGTLFTVFEGLRRFTERNFLPLHPAEPVVEEGAVVVVGGNGEAALAVAPAAAAGARKLSVVDRNFSWRNYSTTAASNFVIGGVAAAVASTVCYLYSAHRYLQTVIHNSAICRGLMPTLAKEVPMMAVMFGAFSALQPLLAPRHGVRCGFGY